MYDFAILRVVVLGSALGLEMDTHNCTSDGAVGEDLASSEQWCICNNCMDRAEKAVNKPVNRSPTSSDQVAQRPISRLTEDLTRKRNQMADSVYRKKCRSYQKDLDFAKNQIKVTTVNSIIDHFSLLKAAETIEHEKSGKNSIKKMSLHPTQIPTISFRKSEDNETERAKKSQNPNRTTRKPVALKRSVTFALGDLPSRSNAEKTVFGGERAQFSGNSKGDIKEIFTDGSRPYTETYTTNKRPERQTTEAKARTASEDEAEYFQRRINEIFSTSSLKEPQERQITPRPQTCTTMAPNTASLRTRNFLQNTVSKYKWVFIPGIANQHPKRHHLTKQMEREKVKIRKSELAAIHADLRRKETCIKRLLRRSTVIRAEMSHVTTGRPPV